MSETVEWLVELSINTPDVSAVANLLNSMASVIKASETGTETWSWYISEDQQTVSILERYSSEAAVLTHLENFGDFAEEFLERLTPKQFTVLAAPSQTVRDAIEGFGPAYRKPQGGFRR